MSGSQKVGAPRGNQNARRHGAPRGNTNALKHGFYSRSFTRQLQERFDGKFQGELTDEEQLIRIILARLAGSTQDSMTYQDHLVVLRAVSLAVGRLLSLHRSRNIACIVQAALEKIRNERKVESFKESTSNQGCPR